MRLESDTAANSLWDVTDWKKPPEHRWLIPPERQVIGQVLYENEPYRGRPTDVFARVGLPDAAFDPNIRARGGVPAMVCLHGGGGGSCPAWVKFWTARGYAAISVDLGGCGPDKGVRLERSGPGQTRQEKFLGFVEGGSPQDAWPYHAVAATIRAISLLETIDLVDADRIGLTGVSWGGYLACHAAGLDDRLKFVAPVYGCGYLAEDSVWRQAAGNNAALSCMDDTAWQEWDGHFDPRHHLLAAKMPMLFVNGTNDFAFALEAWQKSTTLPLGAVTRSLRVDMAHDQAAGSVAVEISIAANAIMQGGMGLATLTEVSFDGSVAESKLILPKGLSLTHATLNLSDSGSLWVDRRWRILPADIQSDRVVGCFPNDTKPEATWFLSVNDERGAVTSTSVQRL